MLDRLKPTATGLDGMPAWYLRLMAPIVAALAALFNQSIFLSIRLFQVNKPIATVTVGDRQTDRHKQYMQYISKRKIQKHT